MVTALDPEKIKKELQDTAMLFVVSPCNLVEEAETAPPIESIEPTVYGTVNVLPADVEASRARLLALRQSVIESGVAPLADDELDLFIDDTRGR